MIIVQATIGILMSLAFTFGFAMLVNVLGRLAAKTTKYN
jgi:ABC-type nickel/cobalt efflux system permease component RcnA